MTESMTMAEMAQPANYAGMNYDGICNYVKTQINYETKKRVGMQVMTHSYVTAMRELARDEEIVYSFMTEMLMAPSSIMSKTIDDEPHRSTTVANPWVIGTPSKKSKRMTEMDLVELAIETVKSLPVPDGIDSKYSYFANYVFKRSNGELVLDKTGGWNEGVSGLEGLKTIERMHMEDRYKKVKTVVVGDYYVYLISGGKLQVTHFNMADGVEPYALDYTQIPEECKKQIEDTKYWASFMASLPENSSCEPNMNEESKESLWTDPSSNVSASVLEKDVVSDEQRLIEKAVEMTKSRGVGMMTDKNAPFFVQDEFKVNDTGELERAIRPFSRNIRIDEFDSFKESHRKRAQTYKASYVSCTDDYTAYIIDGGKTVCVFYYNTRGLEDAA